MASGRRRHRAAERHVVLSLKGSADVWWPQEAWEPTPEKTQAFLGEGCPWAGKQDFGSRLLMLETKPRTVLEEDWSGV